MILIAALTQGWYVSVADDGGLNALFGLYSQNVTPGPSQHHIGNGRYQGQAVLDSLRAVKQSTNITGINGDPTMVSFGYSGGSIAGAWVRANSTISLCHVMLTRTGG